MRQDAAIARLAELVASAAKLKKQSGEPLKVIDFMPWATEEEPEPTVESSIDGVLSAFRGKKHG